MRASLSFFLSIMGLALVAPSTLSLAAQSTVPLQVAAINPHDKSSLQRGARNFMDYCSGCHSLSLVSYHQIENGIGLDERHKDLFSEFMIYPLNQEGEKIKYGEKVIAGFSPSYGAQVFGTKVPDLSLITRVRGKDWLYSYLIAFYQDELKPTGYNNLVFKDVAMPNPFWELQGVQTLASDDDQQLVLSKPGLLTEAEFNRFVLDIVNFLTFVSDPSKEERENTGIWVVLFFALLSFVTYFLHRSFWVDVEKKE